MSCLPPPCSIWLLCNWHMVHAGRYLAMNILSSIKNFIGNARDQCTRKRGKWMTGKDYAIFPIEEKLKGYSGIANTVQKVWKKRRKKRHGFYAGLLCQWFETGDKLWLGCPRNKQKTKKFQFKPKQDLFRVCFGLFCKTKKKNLVLFRCFELI